MSRGLPGIIERAEDVSFHLYCNGVHLTYDEMCEVARAIALFRIASRDGRRLVTALGVSAGRA